MAVDPGNSSSQFGGPKHPPDLNALVKKWFNSGKSRLPSSGPAAIIMIATVIGMATLNSIYTVPSDSVAVVQRFGRFTQLEVSGLHIKFPFAIDQITIVPTKRQLKQEFGLATSGATDPNQTATRDEQQRYLNKRESSPQRGQLGKTQMVTVDLNTALVEWVIQYRDRTRLTIFLKYVSQGKHCVMCLNP